MAYELPSAVEIDRKLRQDFRERLAEFGVSAEATDPILAVLFRTFAVQLEDLYSQTGKIREGLLDELIAGLGLDRRRARAAQTIVRFIPGGGDAALIEAGSELIGEAQSGERLTFTADASVTASRARIAFALCYQEGRLRLLSGVEPAEAVQALRPSLDPVRAALGTCSALYLAIENLPPRHLSGQGFFFDLGPQSAIVLKALQREPWCLAGPEGDFGARGILRPVRVNAGVRRLRWLVTERADTQSEAEPHAAAETPELPDGFYAGRVLTMPETPESRRFTCSVPMAMEKALKTIFGANATQVLETPRAWLRISMPQSCPPLDETVLNISLNAMTASNAECFNETVRFAEHGGSIPVSKEAGAPKHLVAPLAVFGEDEGAYLPQFEPSADAGRGRYGVHNGRIHLEAARHPDGRRDAYANLRLWLTSGSAGNQVGPGGIQSFLKQGSAPAVRVINPTAAAGGTDGETFEDAKRRFAAALLTRDRIVTEADMTAAAKAFDSRIQSVETSLAVERGESGALERVHHVRCRIDRDAFTDPEEELRILREELGRFLTQRVTLGTRLALETAER